MSVDITQNVFYISLCFREQTERRKRRREDEGGHEAAERMERLFSVPEDNPYIIAVVF